MIIYGRFPAVSFWVVSNLLCIFFFTSFYFKIFLLFWGKMNVFLSYFIIIIDEQVGQRSLLRLLLSRNKSASIGVTISHVKFIIVCSNLTRRLSSVHLWFIFFFFWVLVVKYFTVAFANDLQFIGTVWDVHEPRNKQNHFIRNTKKKKYIKTDSKF